ncbi:heavy metal-translocating P-type ATPase, Cd/Co/Hg/Pb/Zn-transporting [Cryptobacterium curtum DSM 15641]|uniref:Heavy metal-translocating P-type ATPase, Cd/Co/Hg/Pb/Zn-transporting n=1 Tax=Cryptobacterium curtum (strain ATCC 700683 / DSM 15641 / CCUG 43107 / 12-3) TaxID=469378 RepID=C7MLA2_CRYCD|nr:heavy metal translocating P-type ATPase [Cryptobacterium curtum]ACU95049.1 heavy metal-translocating P-type ATPase, Cd/Co/Hg/Pb/Zn-transporting [Cryptobacterium curtum DSM 15641]
MTSTLSKSQRRTRNRIVLALGIFIMLELLDNLTPLFEVSGGLWLEFAAFLVPYLIAGYDVLARAGHGLVRRQPFDENLLMAIATIGAFALVVFPKAEPHMAEGAAVMLFYQVGELFESYAVGKTRKSIAEMMDIAPDFANVMRNGELVQVDPYEVTVGQEIVVKPGERLPLDGTVVEGSSRIDTSALTGESIPRTVKIGSDVVSGCINLSGVLTVKVSKPFGESTVQRILELVENASEKKARTENFITRFARYYTPIVVGLAVAIAIFSPLLFGADISDSVQSALVFLVVSCPCALVISVPLSFFGGIGAASRLGILIKGSSYLETLAQVDTVVFDKTGTLTNGTFSVVAVHGQEGINADDLLSLAAHAEAYSDHPIAISVRERYSGIIDADRIQQVEERSGRGISAQVDNRMVLVGNDKLMREAHVMPHDCKLVGTILHVAVDGAYIGHIVIADVMKPDAAQAIERLRAAGVKKTVMLTGDREEVAAAVASDLGIDEYRAQLLPQDKVTALELLLSVKREGAKLAFVGDGINDAPVLMRADVGIAMGGMGSDAAIEAADVVLMDDKPSHIASSIYIARKTVGIVWQNIIFAIGVKVIIMILALPFIGLASMWLAVFGDVGVACLAILNAMRALRVKG